jgi:transposase
MANVLSEEKQKQIEALGRLGWSLRRIEEATGVRRETASAYLKAAGIGVRAPGRWGRAKPAKEVITDSADLAGAKPAKEVITDPDSSATDVRRGRGPACESFDEFICEGLARGRNAMSIYQDLVSVHGFKGSYASVMRYVRRLRGNVPLEARVVILTEPGHEAQVDYGEGPMVRDAGSGRYRRTRLFIMTLGYSRKSVRLLTWRSSSQIWAELHERAFRRLGGVPRIVVLDNLREGVLRPDVHDPTLNQLYSDVLAHYGVIAMPCRVRDPDRKGKVESAIGHTQRTPLKGQRFETLDEAQAYLDRWERQWADTRIHGTTKRQVAAMFNEEKPALLPLPIEPFRYYHHGQRAVHLDGHVEVAGAYYSVPPGLIGAQVPVQWDAQCVRILDPRTRCLLREHPLQARGRHRTADQDRSARTPKTTEQLLARADHAGRHVGTLCRSVHRDETETGVRKILGVLALAKKHGAPSVDSACAVALDVGAPNYRFVRRYIERQPGAPLTLRQIDPLIRELTQYRRLIDHMTKEIEVT